MEDLFATNPRISNFPQQARNNFLLARLANFRIADHSNHSGGRKRDSSLIQWVDRDATLTRRPTGPV